MQNHANTESVSARPPAHDVNPLSKAAPFLALHVDDVRVAPAPASHAVLLLLVPVLPVVVLLEARLPGGRRVFEVGLAGELARGGIGGAVLDRGVSVAEVAEVVDVLRAEEDAGGEGVDGRVAPLGSMSVYMVSGVWAMGVTGGTPLTLSIQKPPLRSIISKKSRYSLLRNQSSRAISKLDQKWHMLYFSPSMPSGSMLGSWFRLGSARSTSSGRDWSGLSLTFDSAGSTNISQRPLDLMLLRRL